MLDRFPVDNIDGQILQRVRSKSLEYTDLQQRGQTIVKQFESSERAVRELNKLVEEKLRKGYVVE